MKEDEGGNKLRVLRRFFFSDEEKFWRCNWYNKLTSVCVRTWLRGVRYDWFEAVEAFRYSVNFLEGNEHDTVSV